MEELEKYRITASDGKVLFSLYYDAKEEMPGVFLKKGMLFAKTVGEAFADKYGVEFLRSYEENNDRLKRIRCAPMICRISVDSKEEGGLLRLLLSCRFFKCGKTLYTFRSYLLYSPLRKSFLPLKENKIFLK